MKKVALIGCGGIGNYHLSHLLQFDDVETVGFCDLLLERAEKFVQTAGCGKAFTDFRVMYEEVQPDMVFICVPPYAHGPMEFETIRRNIPFFVEKPLTLDMDLGRELVRQVEKKGLIAASGFQCRYDNINETAKAYIAEHPILHVAASRVGGIPDPVWWNNKFTSGGQLVEQTIHQLDMLRYLLDTEPKTVYSVPSRGYITQEECPGYFTDDLSTTLITFRNGVTATMMTGCYSLNGASWNSKMAFGARESRMDYRLCMDVTIYGVDVRDRAEEVEGTILGDGTQCRKDDEIGIVVQSQVDYGLICDRTFIDAVLTGDASRIRSPYADAFRSVAFALACNQSMKTGLPTEVVF